MIRVLLADDHAVVRSGLRQIFSETHDIVVSGEAGTAAETLRKIRQGDIDVLVLDISLPDKSGIDVLSRVKKEQPNLPVLILSMYPAKDYALRLLKGGAAGYLNKQSTAKHLVEAVRTVARGKQYLTPDVAALLSDHLLHGEKAVHERLSDREFQVLCEIARGKTVSQIAAELSLSVKTVSTHRHHVLKKMDLKSNAELAHYALKEGLVE